MAQSGKREVTFKSTGSKFSESKSSKTISSASNSTSSTSAISSRTNVDSWATRPRDYINDRYMKELGSKFSTHSPRDDGYLNVVTTTVPKDRVQLINGKIVRNRPSSHSTSSYTYSKEKIVPIQHLGGDYKPATRTTTYLTTGYPRRRPRDVLSHNGAHLHFIA